ncbi:hypothetical protein M5689_008191 [Euphorbia peplus]|nr:hypothetical protein M5689_008191 [Euphorbia peplus]
MARMPRLSPRPFFSKQCIIYAHGILTFARLLNLFFLLLDPDSIPEIPTSSTVSAKELMPTETTLRKDVVPVPLATSLPPKYSMYNMSSAAGRHGSLSLSNDHRNDLKDALLADLKIEENFSSEIYQRKTDLTA